MIRLILISLCIYLIFRYISRHLTRLVGPPEKMGKDSMDKFVACPSCGTYNPMKDAYQTNGNYYCSESCYKEKKE